MYLSILIESIFPNHVRDIWLGSDLYNLPSHPERGISTIYSLSVGVNGIAILVDSRRLNTPFRDRSGLSSLDSTRQIFALPRFRHFTSAVSFIASALKSPGGRLYVNCVFGRSRSTTFVVAYLMIQHDWSTPDALKHIRNIVAQRSRDLTQNKRDKGLSVPS